MYEELIADLRETAEYIGPNNYELPIMLYDNLLKAADAIEELSRTHDADAKEIEWLKMCVWDLPKPPKED